jgi:hypothetical protein
VAASNDSEDILFWLLGAALLVGGGAAVYTMTRGLRDNNPGNIEYSSAASQQWQGLANPPSDGVFAVFTSPTYGIRAMAITLDNYSTSYGLNTVTDIITRWAPPSENDTASYIAAVSGAMGVNPTAPLDLTDPGTMAALIAAIITQENGLNPYSDATIQQGIALA